MHDYLSATVKYRQTITPSMIRIVLEGGDLNRFESTGRPDEFVWLSFPAADNEEGIGRYYTVRHWNPLLGEMTIDFFVHQTGVATNWAKRVCEGETIRLLAPRSRFCPPSDADYYLLMADITGLPAVGRIIEELPYGSKAIAHIEIPCEEDRQSIETAADAELNWHCTFGRGVQCSRLLDIARSVQLPLGQGYIWIAGEASAASQSRKHFRDVLGVDKSHITCVGYWIEGQARV